ncbi:S9 family peptidase [Silvibacterium dinghuense]|uniref:S9 family peptidase n=1 Tax=Silvibacterium dinghuense TaxID=1560006 RepID=A0A4Q1SE72_9BACT|nr:prolyl oligopeptidase family serine peptidase [Silvibacterium dinghuense]RXS95423.1 S9 family peptidase [Silvibacterium dinghuense]GGH13104.1 acyl-peptide hydrolase [Silvibacterium dinghuense]
MKSFHALPLLPLVFLPLAARAQAPISLDEFMNAAEIRDARIAPDGSAAVVATGAPDWQHNRFREDLWLWSKASGKLISLTHSGHDSSPLWSPDGRYIAFLSDRPVAAAEEDNAGKDDEPSRVWILPLNGGEAFPLYTDKLDAHALAWSADGTSLLFSSTEPLSKNQEEANKSEWKDVIRWREQERGDLLLSISVDAARRHSQATPEAHAKDDAPADKPALPADAVTIGHSSLEIDEIAPSPKGDVIAVESGPISHREENPADYEIYMVPAHGGDLRQLTHNQGLEGHLQWNHAGNKLYFTVRAGGGSMEGAYQDVQGRIYSIDPASTKITRQGTDFQGSWDDFTLTAKDEVLATGLTGMDQKIYRIDGDKFTLLASQPGNDAHLEAARNSSAVLYTHSAINDPTQVFVASQPSALNDAKAVTEFNPVFKQRAQASWKPYRWKSPDGTSVEGVLIYPPGKTDAKHLPMLTLIHGGPEDADGDRFGADWYDWATLAAANGWLVFRPNYRGSTGYGDAFMLAIQPHLVSAPGQDILSGVDALVKDGIADPDHLTIGGYSYGGYMTNWLITQTTRFKAAVTGAGAVEHAANWGNDDLTYDDAWYLSGAPWEKPELYQSEAALFQMNKVTTPTHIVGGNADIRVSYFEQVVLERALERLNVPHTLLVFPGEGHPLDRNPWHGYIKVRDELKWLKKYGE